MSYTINLTDRGPSAISSFDLFDECHFGADKLYFRGRFASPSDVLKQIKIALGDTEYLDTDALLTMYPGKNIDEIKTILGIGNPIEVETSETSEVTVPTIALNRYHIQNKKFWNNEIPSNVKNPYKASAAVTFAIRVHFKEDSAYIKMGVPWSAIMNEKEEEIPSEVTSIDDVEDFALLQNSAISKKDAISILESILQIDVKSNTYPESSVTYTLSNIVDENGNRLSIF